MGEGEGSGQEEELMRWKVELYWGGTCDEEPGLVWNRRDVWVFES